MRFGSLLRIFGRPKAIYVGILGNVQFIGETLPKFRQKVSVFSKWARHRGCQEFQRIRLRFWENSGRVLSVYPVPIDGSTMGSMGSDDPTEDLEFSGRDWFLPLAAMEVTPWRRRRSFGGGSWSRRKREREERWSRRRRRRKTKKRGRRKKNIKREGKKEEGKRIKKEGDGRREEGERERGKNNKKERE
ncbi:STRUBBELIG-receptor family 5 [Prunus dulcis]|uniref:STRUBBELIG-receptor family 5 n=1 Tax=Prunus dulcis TaxID=3755 RepID=A0A4Y1RYP3_PRUDU|nr:STRUBBELIG-receptor family 5 [Prunus dulcis]